MSTPGGEIGLHENRNSRICLNFLSHSARTIDSCSIIHLLNEWHLMFWNSFFHMERFHLGHTQAIPHTSVHSLPSIWLLVIPQVSSKRNLHRPLCHMSWGRRRCWRGCHWTHLGRRCWPGRAPAHRPGPWGCSLQRCWTCTTQGLWQKGAAVRTETPEWEEGEGRFLEETVSPACNLSFLFSSPGNLWSSEQVDGLNQDSWLPRLWSNNAPEINHSSNEEILCSSFSSRDIYFQVWLA